MKKRLAWGYVLTTYPYYKNDLSVSGTIEAMNNSTLLTNEEYHYLTETLRDWHLVTVSTVSDGKYLISDLISQELKDYSIMLCERQRELCAEIFESWDNYKSIYVSITNASLATYNL